MEETLKQKLLLVREIHFLDKHNVLFRGLTVRIFSITRCHTYHTVHMVSFKRRPSVALKCEPLKTTDDTLIPSRIKYKCILILFEYRLPLCLYFYENYRLSHHEPFQNTAF